MLQFFHAATAVVCILCGSVSAQNSDHISSLCDSAAHIAAQEFEVPIDVLLAITRTETGRTNQKTLKPWPWTVNMEGTGYWFSGRDDAQSFAIDRYRDGALNFDIGCFQINYRWHGKFFDTIEDMFDPVSNARYAANFLEQLFLEFGSWSAAAGAFHSRTPSKAESYTARFDTIRLNLDALSTETFLSASPLGIYDRRKSLITTTTPLNPLVSSGLPKLGSLVPSTRSSAGSRRVIDIPRKGG